MQDGKAFLTKNNKTKKTIKYSFPKHVVENELWSDETEVELSGYDSKQHI